MPKVVMLAELAAIAGWREQSCDADSLVDLRAKLAKENPTLGEKLSASRVMVIVNDVLVHGDQALATEDEVAFITPVSGG
ncbi:MoaD/ThiS family protein [Brevundimonas sp.]|jgi:molybdopterin converting factor small subunit|uniref:MoaD/ThiS family protein n=1 Tax=Brevundimonas sp. TaxID=1871086 RepID=UPI00289AE670|nr:MoaD/ThiS family protein [Brevundimonas sp.]